MTCCLATHYADYGGEACPGCPKTSETRSARRRWSACECWSAVGIVPESSVKVLRENIGMSQRSLARASGVSQTVISRIESGDASLTRKAAGNLAAALKTDRHDLTVAENLSLLARLAVRGKLSREVAAGVAMHLIENEHDSEAGRCLANAALEELVTIVEAAEIKQVTSLKSRWVKRLRIEAEGPLPEG